jgi:hypothetical protein
MMNDAVVQTVETVSTLQWGVVTYLKIYTPEYKRLSWLQVWQAFADIYPGRWAVELYPPEEELVNDAHVYHLWMLPEGWVMPERMNLRQRLRRAALEPVERLSNRSGRSLATKCRG